MPNETAPQPTQAQKPTTPASGAAPAAPAVDPQLAKWEQVKADAETKLAAAEKARRVHEAEARKFANEKKGIGAKLSEYEQLKKLQSQAKMNKAAFLKATFGDDWYDQIVAERVSGGAPTADTVALEVEKVREEFAKKLEEQRADYEKQQRETQRRQIETELRTFNLQAVEFAKASAKDYPIFETLGNDEQVASAIVQRIRAEHDKTIKRDEETGAVLVAGKVLSMKEAAELIESDLIAIAEKAAGAEKYRARLTEKFKPATVSPVGGPQLRRTETVERRTLSNDLTATTAGRQPATTDEERRQRAIAAYSAVRAKAAQ